PHLQGHTVSRSELRSHLADSMKPLTAQQTKDIVLYKFSQTYFWVVAQIYIMPQSFEEQFS
ncbi:MAG: hypothetical protein MUO67_02945, partial [Anaerolineales bacterium]|nr:hypothetical protein [Anaerolineales bacterium]